MIDATSIIQTFGYIGVFGTVFIETGLLFGFFLPGDSLLFVSGLFSSFGYLDIRILVIGTILSAFFGDLLGYYIGKTYGKKVFQDPRISFLKEEYIETASLFFQKHGPKSLVLARFVPIMRTFVPVFAGIGSMPLRTFLIFNALGAFLWVFSLQVGAFYLGSFFPWLADYIDIIVIFIVFLSVAPGLYSFFKVAENRKKTFLFIKGVIKNKKAK